MIFLITVFFLFLYLLFFWKWKKNKQKFYLEERPIIFGHRGAPTQITENTLLSFTKALEQGAEGFEFDIRLTSDGEIVIFHDDSLLRMCGVNIKIRELSYEALQEHYLKKEKAQEESETIPLLEETVTIIDKAQAVNIEIKSDALFDGHDIIKPFIEFLDLAQIDKKCIVSSFNPLILLKLKHKRPQTVIGLLYTSRTMLHSIYNMLWILICRPDNLHIHYNFLDSWIVRWAKFKGMHINSYTINHKEVYKKAKELKIDGVFTDNIEYLK